MESNITLSFLFDLYKHCTPHLIGGQSTEQIAHVAFFVFLSMSVWRAISCIQVNFFSLLKANNLLFLLFTCWYDATDFSVIKQQHEEVKKPPFLRVEKISMKKSADKIVAINRLNTNDNGSRKLKKTL